MRIKSLPLIFLPLVLAGFVVIAPSAIGQDKPSSPPAAPAPAAAAAAAPAPPASPYAGEDVCGTCHEEIAKSFKSNPHHVIDVIPLGKTKVDFEGKACEACHGPGAKHADSVDPKDIRQPAKLPTVESVKICNTCHFNSRVLNGRDMGGHGRNQVPCVSCHKIHEQRVGQTRTNPQVVQLCRQCHSSVVAEFNRPHHHPVPEGAMSCVDCHNPHGGSRVKQLVAVNGNEPGCLKCHGDKRGPFMFEHAPVKLEGCQTCHEPHGSANPRMLRRHEERFLCLECHANLGTSGTATGTIGSMPPAFHDLRSPRFDTCSTCHVKVHGSQASRAFLR